MDFFLLHAVTDLCWGLLLDPCKWVLAEFTQRWDFYVVDIYEIILSAAVDWVPSRRHISYGSLHIDVVYK